VRGWLVVALVACGKQPSPPELERIDVFGSKTLTRGALLEKHEAELVALVRDDGGDLERTLSATIQAEGGFAFAHASRIQYHGATPVAYVTVDIVDADDRAARMTFSRAPTGEYPDPDGLIARWGEYEDAWVKHLDKQVRATCEVWHCLDEGDPALASFRADFTARVPAHEAELATILRDDKRFVYRARAAFLLAHLASGDRVVQLELPAIHDPEELVRNNALRVLAKVAMNHPEIAIPVAPIVEALHYPETTDRNKAAYVLTGLVKHPDTHDAIRTRAGDVLVDMLSLAQPINHDPAYTVLKALAGRDLGEHDVDAWRAWLRSQR
jgi:hypothetical protein